MRFRFSILLILAAATAACDDGLGPQAWDDTPDTVTIYSASRTDQLGQPTAFDFVNHSLVRVENAGTAGAWDIMLTGTSSLQFVPASAFQGQSSRAGIATITSTTFESLTEAPSDTASYKNTAVTLKAGDVYVVRSRRYACSYTTAVNYAKVKIVDVNPTAGFARFSLVRNPYCNDRSFVPPKQ